ncbi:MAG TPA: toll/interleukin-1 receptor domain-containing protein, partial [Ktedonobacterales bacterium]|nr:toll/interleukin-1 receptor domain-containing protein [Ktedonobacterales bacterium]
GRVTRKERAHHARHAHPSPPIFVSHCHEDNAWCRDFVAGLRTAGADVWYDEHNLGYGGLSEEIERELRARPIFIVVLSPVAVTRPWVRREVDGAIRLKDREPERIFLPVVAEKCEVPLLWEGYRRTSGPGDTALPAAEAAGRVIHALGLAPAAAPPVAPPPAPAETAAQAWERGKGLRAQGRFQEALTAYERAISLDSRNATYWNSKGVALGNLKRPSEALAAYEQALALDPKYTFAWTGKGNALRALQRPAEALAAFEQALTLDPKYTFAWNNKINLLGNLGRKAEADEARRQRDAALK